MIARVAWNALTIETQHRVIALLERAPGDAGLLELEPTTGPRSIRERTFFELASTWADPPRKSLTAERQTYAHPTWHYINIAWTRAAPDDSAVIDTTRPPPDTNVVERISALEKELADTTRPASERAIDLAWLLHLVGDLHQPLHASAYVSPEYPDGDRGGNLVRLSNGSLHILWDRALSMGDRRRQNESADAYMSRLAGVVTARKSAADAAPLVAVRNPALWARESLRLAQDSVYTPAIVPGTNPPPEYRAQMTRVAERQVAIAGYRLAATLNRIFAQQEQ